MIEEINQKGFQIKEKIEDENFKIIYTAIDVKNSKTVFITLFQGLSEPEKKLLKSRCEKSSMLKNNGLLSATDFGNIGNDNFYYVSSATRSRPLMEFARELTNDEDRIFLLTYSFLEILKIIKYIHSSKTVHGNLSTKNLRISHNNTIIVEGFIHSMPSTKNYMQSSKVNFPYLAPEQLVGASSDMMTDIYSLGTIFFELLTGDVPYLSNVVKITKFKEGSIPSPKDLANSIPEEINFSIMRALSQRHSRYKNVNEFISSLEKFYAKRSLKYRWRDFILHCKSIFSTIVKR